ncbi:site-2 protease family protein [Nakamurella silvestris]|nr:site-2 protease family protein [Nakamurella silvestris]
MRPAGNRNRDNGKWIFPGVLAVTVGAGIAAAASVTPLGIWIFLLVLGGWVITLCLHEFMHALIALYGGDVTVRYRGYLTLNPLKYTDVGMSLLVPVVLLAVGGIPLPGGAVLIDHGRLRSRAWQSLVSLGGPATNFLAGIILAYVGASLDSPLGYGLSYLALLQFVTAVLNLLPVPGLDGFGIISPYLSNRTQEAIRPFRPWAPLLLFVILISFPTASGTLWDIGDGLLRVFGGSEFNSDCGSSLFRFWTDNGLYQQLRGCTP